MSFSDSPTYATVSECDASDAAKNSGETIADNDDSDSFNMEVVAVECPEGLLEGPALTSPGLIGVGLMSEDRVRMESTEWELSSSSGGESHLTASAP